MKVGFIGAGGTGKTSVLNALRGKISIPILPSVTKDILRENNITEADQNRMTPEERWILQKQIYARRLENEAQHTSFISDRTIIDHLFYCLQQCWSVMSSDETAKLIHIAKENINSYDLLFYFSTDNFLSTSDPMIINSMAYSYLSDSAIRGLISKTLDYGMSNYRLWTVPPGPIDQRSSFVLRKISNI